MPRLPRRAARQRGLRRRPPGFQHAAAPGLGRARRRLVLYVVKSNGEGSNSRVQLQFTNAVTRERIDFRYEFGKTVIG